MPINYINKLHLLIHYLLCRFSTCMESAVNRRGREVRCLSSRRKCHVKWPILPQVVPAWCLKSLATLGTVARHRQTQEATTTTIRREQEQQGGKTATVTNKATQSALPARQMRLAQTKIIDPAEKTRTHSHTHSRTHTHQYTHTPMHVYVIFKKHKK